MAKFVLILNPKVTKKLSIEDVCHDRNIHCNIDGLKPYQYIFSTLAMQRFWIHRRQADVEMKSGGENVENIKKHLNFAAASLGKPIPNRSRLELFASAIWQLTHQLLYRLGISRWFVNRAGGFALTEADRYVNNTICIGILYQ